MPRRGELQVAQVAPLEKSNGKTGDVIVRKAASAPPFANSA